MILECLPTLEKKKVQLGPMAIRPAKRSSEALAATGRTDSPLDRNFAGHRLVATI
jgi:hypothetical protein